ncbi:serine/threonine-protein kinase [Streptomyces sp. LaPpAH-108]|uniref:serine/threonine-protein kinase n=1 Tax=Streptomyces sp. LaPpAH-108 TaxID=1155714 RepID=UPI0003A086CE|nr:serine/threonine-protein kinase [Streptomyces sp. LaPpAH-108]
MPWGPPVSEEPGRDRLIAGRYRLLSPLGQGGMGTVWRARDEVLHRDVAVKEVRAPAGLPASDVERMYARLEREAWAAARISHRNVVTVYDVAMEGGRPWIVMELVRGRSLADALEAEGPLPPDRVARIGAEVLAALRAAHIAGVLHRDVKPANVLLAEDGRVVLTDFGIATLEGSSAITMTGEVIGSPEFLPPERALGRTPGPESDLWSLGVLLYAAVEGGSPFRRDTPLNTLRSVVEDELPEPRRAGPLAPVIEGLLRKDPADRLPADRAEQDLRLVAAGGTPRTDTLPTVPYAPTAWTPQPPAPTPPPPTTPLAGTGSGSGAGSGSGEDPRHQPPPSRGARVALIAGVLALALAVGGLTYALLHRDNGTQGDEGKSGTSPTAGTTTHSPTRNTKTAAPAPTRSSSAASTAPTQSVRVTVVGEHTEYDDTCPPPDEDAPTFTATFTVGKLPAQVEYRWRLQHGSLPDDGWRTLSFPADGERTKRVRVTVTTWSDSGTIENAIGVEVRSPVKTESDQVPFSVTCRKTTTETPTDGASASATYSP